MEKSKPLTTQEKIKLIGKRGLLNCGGLNFEVEILDARDSFGRTDLLVKPISGTGEKWASLETVTVNK